MFEIVAIIAPLFLIIFGSAFLTRLKIADEHWITVLNNYALKIGFPALIFAALSKTTFHFAEHAGLIIANSVFLLGSFLLAYIIGRLFKLPHKLFRTLFLCLAFGNVAYLGIPVLVQMWGDAILPTASIIVAVYLFWLFTVGIGYLEFGRKQKKAATLHLLLLKLLKNPLLLAVILGIIVSAFQVPIPGIIQQSISMISASVTPIVLIVIGLFLGGAKFGKLSHWYPIIAFSLVTLLVIPSLFYFGLLVFGFSVADFSHSIVEAAMPLAITPFALADEYNLDKHFIARSIVLSTVLSIVTLPFWISLF